MRDSANEMLDYARQKLFLAVKLSKQGSYARRAPDSKSLPHFGEAKRLLRLLLEEEPNNREALLMMSQVSESVLDFTAAISYLERAFEAGEPQTKKLLKRLVLLRENSKDWKRLKLSPQMLSGLGSYLEAMGVGPNHRTFDFTYQWLSENVDNDDPDEIIAAFEERGAFTDFQVLANIVNG